MKRTNTLGVALVAALSASLLNGCTSDSAGTTATSSEPAPATSSAPAPATNPLVGTWGRARRELPEGSFGVLEFRADGTMTYSAGDARDTLQVVDTGTYQADEATLTYLTSSYCDGPTDKATYTYQVSNAGWGQSQVDFMNKSGDDKCVDRKTAMEATEFLTPWLPTPTPS
jgi:VCBS repeat-containing protein